VGQNGNGHNRGKSGEGANVANGGNHAHSKKRAQQQANRETSHDEAGNFRGKTLQSASETKQNADHAVAQQQHSITQQ